MRVGARTERGTLREVVERGPGGCRACLVESGSMLWICVGVVLHPAVASWGPSEKVHRQFPGCQHAATCPQCGERDPQAATGTARVVQVKPVGPRRQSPSADPVERSHRSGEPREVGDLGVEEDPQLPRGRVAGASGGEDRTQQPFIGGNEYFEVAAILAIGDTVEAFLAADPQDLLQRQADLPSSSIAADTLEAVGHLTAEWHKAVMEFDKIYREQLESMAVEQFLGVVRHLDDQRAPAHDLTMPLLNDVCSAYAVTCWPRSWADQANNVCQCLTRG